MGYYIEMVESNFVIKKENLDEALKSLKSTFVPENMTTYDYYDNKRHFHFKWVNTDNVLESEDLGTALAKIRYAPIYNYNGDICNVKFIGEKYGDEYVFFEALAPYVESGSYINFLGEDGCAWQWNFSNGKVNHIE